jgi:predicted CoA-binding protein
MAKGTPLLSKMTITPQNLKHDWPQTPQNHCVVVLGASPKPARYSNQAVRRLIEQEYRVIPVHPKVAQIEHLPVVNTLRTITEPVHTLTLYIGAQRSHKLIDDIIEVNPMRVIFNPGSESIALEQHLRRHHIACIHGCTLVMLQTGQFSLIRV